MGKPVSREMVLSIPRGYRTKVSIGALRREIGPILKEDGFTMMIKQMNRILFFFCCFFLLSSAFAWQKNHLLSDERNTIEVFKKAAPKVVFIHRVAIVRNGDYQLAQIPDGAGSGIIWDKAGHVITNYHVIKGADRLSVSIGNTVVPAKIIGVEPRKDIAVLQLMFKKTPKLLQSFEPFVIAPTRALLVGQKTIAIGNPFGLDHTLTTGVVSALERQFPGIGGVMIRDMIQTDAAINPGNSGGPLLDSSGQLIGMNTAIYSQSGSFSGIGFAVPADDIQRIVNQIIKHGRIVLAGIGIQRVESNIAKQLGVKKGVLIGQVLPHTPAARARLVGTTRNNWGRIQLGDVITAINARPIKNYDALYNVLSDIPVGEVITVTVSRNGKKAHFRMKTIDIGGL